MCLVVSRVICWVVSMWCRQVLVDNGVDVAELLSNIGIEASSKAETAGEGEGGG